MDVTSRLLFLIKQNNITANKLTSDLNLSNSAVTDWKKGKAKPSIDAIIKIAEYFNVTTDWLLTGRGTLPLLAETPETISDQQELLDLYSQLDERSKGEVLGFIKAKIDN